MLLSRCSPAPKARQIPSPSHTSRATDITLPKGVGMLPGVWSNIAGEGERHGEPAPPEPTSPSLNPCVFGAWCWSCTQPHGQTMSSQSHCRQPPLPTPAKQPAPLRLTPGPHRHQLDTSCRWRQAAPAHIPKINHIFNRFKKDWSLRRDHKP